MTLNWKLFLLTILFLNPGGGGGVHSNIQTFKISNTNYNLVECLKNLIENEHLTYEKNIRISVETETILAKWNFDDMLTRYFVTSNNNNLVVELQTIRDVKQSSYTIHTHILLVDTFNSMRRLITLQRSFSTDISGMHQYYYVLLQPIGKIENLQLTLEKIMDFCLKNFIKNINILVEEESGIITIYTYYPFNEEKCRDSTPIIHNYYIDRQLKWTKPIFPKKLNNFWKCPLVTVIAEDVPLVTVIEGNNAIGFDVDVIKSLAEIMNFTIDVLVLPEKHNAIKKVIGQLLVDHINDSDLMIGGFLCSKERIEHFAGTDYFSSSSLQLVVKKPKKYSSMEILLFPFDWYTWLILLFIFSARAIGLVLWKKFFKPFFCLGKFSSRIQLLSWLMGILVIKSSYEGLVFKFIHNQPQRKIPSDFEESMTAGYKYLAKNSYHYALDPFFDTLPEKIFYIDVTFMELFDEFDKLDDKYAVFTTCDELIVHKNDATRYERYYTIKKPVHSNVLCIYMPKFSFLTAEFQKRIKQMSYSGLIKFIYDKLAADSSRKKYVGNKRVASIMTLHQLMGACQLLMVLSGIATCFFALELLSSKYLIFKIFLDYFH